MSAHGNEWIALWDGRSWPGRTRNGVTEFGWRQAPAGLSTRSQLREKGLRPAGQEPFGRLAWRKDQRTAWLYRDDLAKPKRTATPAQMAAVEKALAARKVCGECGPVDHFVRTSDGLCGDCYAEGVEPASRPDAAWRTVQAWDTGDADEGDDENDSEAAQAVRGADAASVAVDAAAGAVARLCEEQREREAAGRDDELARWHDDDQAAQAAANTSSRHGHVHGWEAGAA